MHRLLPPYQPVVTANHSAGPAPQPGGQQSGGQPPEVPQPSENWLISIPRRIMRRLVSMLMESRFRISTQLYTGLGGGVVFTISASLIAWLSFNQVGEMQRQVNEKRIPEIVSAFEVARQTLVLAEIAPQLTTSTGENFKTISKGIAPKRRTFENLLASLSQHETVEAREHGQVASVIDKGATLMLNLQVIENSVAERIVLTDRAEARRLDIEALEKRLSELLIPAIDDQLFYTMTGYSELDKPPASKNQYLSAEEIDRYKNLAKLAADTTLAMQLISSTYTLSDGALIEPLTERFEATVGSIQRSLAALGEGSEKQAAAPLFERFFAFSLGDEGSFKLRARVLSLNEEQRALIFQDEKLANELVDEVNSLVSRIQAQADEATFASSQSITQGRNLLLALNVISIIGTILIAWLFVGRVLLRRIKYLSHRMHDMADGDLEGEIIIRGRDEVAEMAGALEGFRQNALEVQRLNLVEKLAEELESKNQELGSALDNLRHAQDQVVAQQKLAALGELTAGVAHEIRNPLNFVNNFSAASEELLEEMKTYLPGKGERLTKENLDGIAETTELLDGNLKRIRDHGERANQIITDMLGMGRGSDDVQEVDVNKLVGEYTRLAFHAAKANDSEFRLDMQTDLDPAAGTIHAEPQDMGRVFLNLVTNACYATNERRLSIEGEGQEPDAAKAKKAKKAKKAADAEFHPSLWITSHNLGEEVAITVKDNGTGIPKEMVDKIFNPFFTTKPTTQGTGLGLALSNDIVRKHGGTIEVDTKEGEYTIMTVTLPRKNELSEQMGSAGASDPSEKSDSPEKSKPPDA